MEKILIITYYWPPSGGAGVQRWVKFTKYLTRMGYEPYVLTVDPALATYPQRDESLMAEIPGDVKIFTTKTRELYSVYNKVSAGNKIPYGGFANSKKVDWKEKLMRFIRGNFFIPDPRKGWNPFAYTKAKELIKEFDIQIVITTSPLYSTQLIGLRLKSNMGIKWIADFRDPWTDIYYFKLMHPTFITTAIHKSLERKVLRNANKIITVSDELRRLFAKKANGIKDKTEVVPNGFDSDDFDYKEASRPENDFFRISYIGTISNQYNISCFIKGISNLPVEVKSKLKIRFVG